MNNYLIAQLKAKYCRQNQTSSYWILELKPHSALTKQLLNTKPPKSTTFFLFNEKTRWASRLQTKQDYYWVYQVKTKANQCYYQIQDWKLLGEPKLVNRCWQFFKNYVPKTP